MNHVFFNTTKKYYNAIKASLQQSPIFGEKRCPSCHKPFIAKETTCVHAYVCAACTKALLPENVTRCFLCGHILYDIQKENKQPLCLRCLQNPPAWNTLSYFGLYDKLLKQLILQYKYNADFSLIPLFTHCLATAYTQMCKQSDALCQMLIPMPRHTKRLGAEGFNQMLELCRPLSKNFAIPLHTHALERSSYRPPQVTLSADKRRKNPAQSFFAHANVTDKHILLVDDVMTTGATLHHATLALHAAKAKSVHIILIAKVAHEMDYKR